MDKVPRSVLIAMQGRFSTGKTYILWQLQNIEERKKGETTPGLAISAAPETSGVGFIHDRDRNHYFIDTEGALAPPTLWAGKDGLATEIDARFDEMLRKKLSLCKSKQFLLERVVRNVSDVIVLVLDKITDDDQHRIFDIVTAAKRTGQQLHVVCNFQQTIRDMDLIEEVRRAFGAIQLPADLSPPRGLSDYGDVFTAQWPAGHFKVYVLWKDHHTAGLEWAQFESMWARNTATLAALSDMINAAPGKQLDSRLEAASTKHPVIRVAREIGSVLPDVVRLYKKDAKEGAAQETEKTADGDVNEDNCRVVPPAEPGSVRVAIGEDVSMEHRSYDRMGGLASNDKDELPVCTTEFNDSMQWKIAAPGCAFVYGKEKSNAQAYVHVKRCMFPTEKYWEVAMKPMKFSNNRNPEEDVEPEEIKQRLDIPAGYSKFPTKAQLKTLHKDGIVLLKAEMAPNEDEDEDEVEDEETTTRETTKKEKDTDKDGERTQQQKQQKQTTKNNNNNNNNNNNQR